MRRLSLFFLIFVAAACGEAPDSTTGSADSAAGPVDGKADIYGNDDRHDLAAVSSQTAREVGESTAALVNSYLVADAGADHVRLAGRTLASKQSAIYGAPLCSDERFADEPAPASCSAFLIAPDLVATAGHCVNITTGCNNIGVAFGFDNGDGDATLLPTRDYRRCKAVVGHLYDRESIRGRSLVDRRLYSDWAVIQLDAPVHHRQPLTIRGTKVGAGEQVIAVGHPGGVPTKVTYGSVVEEPEQLWFNTDLDIYRGNSGSVIVDRNGAAVGIVSRGTGGASYTIDRDRGCVSSKQCDEFDPTSTECAGNQGIHVDALNRFQRAEPIALDFDGGWDHPIPLNGAPLRIPFDLEQTGFIHYVTLNARISHNEPKSLEYSLVAPDGTRRVVMDRPLAWTKMLFNPSRTTFEFGGSEPSGRWFLEVRDTEPSATGSQRLESAQLVFGIGQHRPDALPSWVGSACASDSDCRFENRGTPGQCFRSGDSGFCTLPCDGFCPDREGFAGTFCIASDFGAGMCATTPAPLNAFCDDVPGATPGVRDRFVGASSARETSREVCAPR